MATMLCRKGVKEPETLAGAYVWIMMSYLVALYKESFGVSLICC